MTTAAKPKGLHAKLAEVMAEAERIPKNGTAPPQMGGFKFVQSGDAADFIRKALGTRGVSMLPTAVELVERRDYETKNKTLMTEMTVRQTWTLTDSDTGETATIQSIGSGADTGDKAAPKAMTSAMKYAHLTGFMLSTGDDVEQHDTSDRRARSGLVYDEPLQPIDSPPREDGSLIGIVEKGKPPTDLELRQTPDGPAWGFRLKDGRKAYQVMATGALADALAVIGGELAGERVQVWGRIEMVEWKKGDRDMPPFARVHLERIAGSDFILPAPEADSVPLWDPAESARLDAEG